MRDLAPIVANRPDRRLPSNASEAIAMYSIAPPESREELMNLARLVQTELRKIQAILDDVNQRLRDAAQSGGEGSP